MPIERITKRSVDAAKPGTKNTFLWDRDLAGFGVKITPAGRKVFIVQYRLSGLGRRGITKRLTIGEYDPLSPEEARTLARKELGRVAHGLDPSAERSEKRAAPTVEEFGETYFKDVRVHRKPRTADEYERLWEKHVLPAIGSKRVVDVVTADIRRLHTELHKTPYLANRVVAMLGGFFTLARKDGVLKTRENPAHDIEFFPETPRERFLTQQEFGRLGEALRRAESEGLPPAPSLKRKPGDPEKQKHRPKIADKPIPANPPAVTAIRLLILTGCRENEILSLRWDAVDLERGYLRFGDTKTGKSVRPLSKDAAAIIDAQSEVEGNPYVLPGRKTGEHLKEIKRLWYAVRHAAKLDDVRLHDIRHSFASVPASSGESMLILKSLLGHKRVATTERYAHLGDDPVKRAADETGRGIASWLGAGKRGPALQE